MALIMELPLELLNLIIIFLAMSCDGARDWARVSATCKVFMTLARRSNVLRVVNCQNVTVVGARSNLHLHIDGVLSRCVQAGNPNAEYMLAKAVLAGETPLWKMMLESDLTNSSIKSATALPLSERRNMAKSLNSGSIADLPYILYASEDLPHVHESCERLHHARLLKSFISLADPTDVIELRHALKDFIEFFVGYDRYLESGIDDAFRKMCWYDFLTPVVTRPSKRLATTLRSVRVPTPPSGFPSYRDQVIFLLEDLFNSPSNIYHSS